MGKSLPMEKHKSPIRTFLSIHKTHDPISMRSRFQRRAGGISQGRTGPFAYNKRRDQKPYTFVLSYLEDRRGVQTGHKRRVSTAAAFRTGFHFLLFPVLNGGAWLVARLGEPRRNDRPFHVT